MKKKTLALVSMLISILMFTTGCGVNEREYINLAMEMAQLEEFTFTNQTTINLGKMISEEDINIELKLDGKTKVDENKEIYSIINAKLKCNGVEIKTPVTFKMENGNIYTTNKSMYSILELVQIMGDKDQISDIKSTIDIIESQEVEYILVGDFYSQPMAMQILTQGTSHRLDNLDNSDVLELFEKHIVKAFSGLDSSIITKTQKGSYVLELTPEIMLDLIRDILDYVNNNKETIFDAVVAFVADIHEKADVESQLGISKEETLEGLKQSRAELYAAIEDTANQIHSAQAEYMLQMIKGSIIREETSKQGDSYIQEVLMDIVFEGERIFKIDSKSVSTPSKVEVEKLNGKVMSVEEIESIVSRMYNMKNPVVKMDILWERDSEYEFNWASLEGTRKDGREMYDFKDYELIDGRVYLPLRDICEYFGEEVEWDNSTQSAYIVRGEERIDMTGTVVNSKTLVKIRDFEKLGYSVDYREEDGLHIATITKK